MSVIDAAARFAHAARVLTEEEIKAELVRQLAIGAIMAKDVADHLHIGRPRVTEMAKGQRRVQQAELKPLAEFLGMMPTEDAAVPSIKELTSMLAFAHGELQVGLTFADYPEAVASSLHAQLRQFVRSSTSETDAELEPPQDPPSSAQARLATKRSGHR